ncbi:MAG: HesA/MoeB/ThiF family protein [Deltaproteobacteria bacterium]|nr:HesA/MoeB/ThiF family protein [Deltaproteobacteria bacterium]
MLTARERMRYARQILLPQWQEAAQEQLKRSTVLVVGAGGLGSAVLTYLAVAGVGRIRIIDSDSVDLTNLNRQMLYGDQDVGRKKVDSAKERLEKLNPDIRIEPIAEILTEENALHLVGDNPIVDALDNLPARLLLNRVSLSRNLPLFHGAVYGFEGRATTFLPGRTACLRCLYKEVVPGTAPVVGVTPGLIGCVQAAEVIKYVLGIGDLLCNRLLIYDGISLKFSEVNLRRDPACPDCGSCLGSRQRGTQ